MWSTRKHYFCKIRRRIVLIERYILLWYTLDVGESGLPTVLLLFCIYEIYQIYAIYKIVWVESISGTPYLYIYWFQICGKPTRGHIAYYNSILGVILTHYSPGSSIWCPQTNLSYMANLGRYIIDIPDMLYISNMQDIPNIRNIPNILAIRDMQNIWDIPDIRYWQDIQDML